MKQEQKSFTKSIRFTENEMRYIENEAANNNMNVSEYIRHAALNRGSRTTPEEMVECQNVLNFLNEMATNMEMENYLKNKVRSVSYYIWEKWSS